MYGSELDLISTTRSLSTREILVFSKAVSRRVATWFLKSAGGEFAFQLNRDLSVKRGRLENTTRRLSIVWSLLSRSWWRRPKDKASKADDLKYDGTSDLNTSEITATRLG